MSNPNRIVDIYSGNWHLIIEYIPDKDIYGLYEYVFDDGRWTTRPVCNAFDKSLEKLKKCACSAFWDIL